MSKQIIQALPIKKKPIPSEPHLLVSEFFYDTIQGENFIGYPAAFLRMQHCTLNCVWCDTSEVWRYGNPYTFQELFTLMENTPPFLHRLQNGQRLVLTGGSPLKQQAPLIAFLQTFQKRYGFKPFIEIENECTLFPRAEMIQLVDIWNNSPKLEHSGNARSKQYRPPVLKLLSGLPNSWFKFVVNAQDHWDEIERDFLDPGYIRKDQIVLMPLGASRQELLINTPIAVELAIRHGVRYSGREHIMLWDQKTGV